MILIITFVFFLPEQTVLRQFPLDQSFRQPGSKYRARTRLAGESGPKTSTLSEDNLYQ